MCCKGDLSSHIAGRTICRFTDQNAESDENRDMPHSLHILTCIFLVAACLYFQNSCFYSVSNELDCNKNLSPDYSIQRAKSGQGIVIDDNFQCCNTRN